MSSTMPLSIEYRKQSPEDLDASCFKRFLAAARFLTVSTYWAWPSAVVKMSKVGRIFCPLRTANFTSTSQDDLAASYSGILKLAGMVGC